MRIYDGSPRQDWEEVLRSIGAFLDSRAMRDILLVEAPDGFIVQGLVLVGATSGAWSDAMGQIEKETLTFLDDDIARFMEEAVARRRADAAASAEATVAGSYERALRIIGRYIDEQKPRDVFFFEQDGAFVVRLHQMSHAGSKHVLAEFTRDDIELLLADAPHLRQPPAGAPGAAPAARS